MKEELKSIGLTDGEIEVYITLLKLGQSTNSPIAKHSGLQSSSVYYCLNSLIEKGFVNYILKGNRKHFLATNPENISSILEEKEKELKEQRKKVESVIPILKNYSGMIKVKTTAEVYEGFKGFQMSFREILKELGKGDSYRAFVIEQDNKELEVFFNNYNRELKRRGIKLYLLGSERMRPIFEKLYGKNFLKSYQEIKYTSQTIPVGITIYKNVIITHIWEDNKPISIKVKNQKLANDYMAYFDFVWKGAKA